MARYTGPKTRIARKFGEAIFGPDKVLSKKNYPPGQHGANKRRKTSEYGIQLREKQKAKYTYGVLEKQFRNLFEKASRTKGIKGEVLLQLLEARLDNVVYRLGMALLNQKELKFREALEEFNRMITDYPNDASLLKARANLEIEMNTPDLALLDLESAAKLSPKDAEIYVMCGEIYLSQKKKREAYVAFEKAIELGVPRPELQDKLKASK